MYKREIYRHIRLRFILNDKILKFKLFNQPVLYLHIHLKASNMSGIIGGGNRPPI